MTNGRFSDSEFYQNQFSHPLPRVWSTCLERLNQEINEESWLSALWFLRDSIECGVRLLVCIGLAERLKTSKNSSDKTAALHALQQLLGGLPTLGTWVQILRLLAESNNADPVTSGLSALSSASKYNRCWNDLFEGGDNFVAYRNRTLGHGAFTRFEDIQPQVLRFRNSVFGFAENSCELIWQHGRIGSPALDWWENDPALLNTDLSFPKVGWHDAHFISERGNLVLNPLARIYINSESAPPELLLFNYLKITFKNPERAKATFLDYRSGLHRSETTYFPIIKQYWSDIANSNYRLNPAARKSEQIKFVDDSNRFTNRRVPVRYIEKQLVKIAQECLSQGRYVLITGEAGTGKSWLMRSLTQLASDPEAPDWQVGSYLHSERCLKLRFSLVEHGLNNLWDELRQQAKAAGFDVGNDNEPNELFELGAWVSNLQKLNFDLVNGFVLIGIDGLDECADSPEAYSQLRAWLSCLPGRCMVLLLSRPEVKKGIRIILDYLMDREKDNLNIIQIDSTSADNIALQKFYLQSKLKVSDTVISDILKQSGGVFLYTFHLANALQKGLFESAAMLPSKETFYFKYLQFFRRQIGTTNFNRTHLRFLLVLACSKMSLSLETLHEDWSLPPPETLETVVHDLGEFLQTYRTEGDFIRFSIAHETFRAFITNSYKDAIYDLEEVYAASILARVEAEGGWEILDYERDEGALYAILYLPYHSRKNKNLSSRIIGDQSAARTAHKLSLANSSLANTFRVECARRAISGYQYLIQQDKALSEELTSSLFTLAEMLRTVGAAGESLDILNNIELAPTSPLGVKRACLLADAYRLLGDLESELSAISIDETLLQKVPVIHQSEYLLTQASYLERIGKPLEGMKAAMRATSLPTNLEEQVKAFMFAATCAFYASKNNEGINILDKMKHIHGEYLQDNVITKMMWLQTRGLVLHNLDRNAEVVECHRECRDFYSSRDDIQNYILSLINIADGLWGLGIYQGALHAAEQALIKAKEKNLPHTINIINICLANIMADAAPSPRVYELYSDGIDLSEKIGHEWDALYGRIYESHWLSRTTKAEQVSTLLNFVQQARHSNYGYLAALAQTFATIAASKEHLDESKIVELAEEAVLLSEEFEVPAAFAISGAILLEHRQSSLDIKAYDACLAGLQGVKAELQLVKNAAFTLSKETDYTGCKKFLKTVLSESDSHER